MKEFEKELIASFVDFEILAEVFHEFSLSELGSIKIRDLKKKLLGSNILQKFISETRKIQSIPGSDDFLGAIHSSISFMFSNAETVSTASVFLLIKWCKEVYNPYLNSDLVENNRKIVHRFFSIIEKGARYKINFSSQTSFSNRLFEVIKRDTLPSILHPKFELNNDFEIRPELFSAMKNDLKTEFRCTINLDLVNRSPNEWDFCKANSNSHVNFTHSPTALSLEIISPFKLGQKICLKDIEGNTCNVIITSFFLQRIKEVNNRDAINEGYSFFSEQIEEIFINTPYMDAELCLFIDDWNIQYPLSYYKNEWVFAFEFKKYTESNIKIGAIKSINFTKLSAEQLKALELEA